MCRSLKIFDLKEIYQVLSSVWPHTDKRNYYTTIEHEKMDYKSFINCRSNKDGCLGRVILPKPEFNTLNSQTLDLEVKKWKAKMKDRVPIKKLLYTHLASDHLSKKIKRNS